MRRSLQIAPPNASRPSSHRLSQVLLLCVASLWTVCLAAAPATLTGDFAPSRGTFDAKRSRQLLKETAHWDSFQNHDAHKGSLVYGPFKAGNTIELDVAGHPWTPGVQLELVARDSGARLALKPTANPGVYWTRYHWRLPPTWAQQQCLLVAEDHSIGGGGWIGVSEPLPVTGQYTRAAIESLLQVIVFLLLLAPGIAAILFLPQLKPSLALVFVLTFSALTAYAILIASVWHSTIGTAVCGVVYAFCITSYVSHRTRLIQRFRQFDFAAPLILATAAATLYFAGAFMYGGIESPEGVPMSRFLPNMPPDPLLPYWFAKLLATNQPVRPFFLDWLTSDRPPLQTALYLLVWPLVPVRYAFQVVGIAAQCWVLVALWSYLRLLGVGRSATALVFAGAAFAGFFIVNSVFCWPKLLPAAFLLIAAAVLWGIGEEELPPSVKACLVGTCLAFAMLGHGGSFFGALALALAYVLHKRPISPRLVLIMALGGLVVMTPWLLYQKLIDPPGDRLVKYHIAGREAIDTRPSLTVIREAYSELTWREYAQYKWQNVKELWGSEFALAPTGARYVAKVVTNSGAHDELHERRNRLRGIEYTHYLQSLGPLLLGLPGLLVAIRKPKEDSRRRAAFLALELAALSIAVWCLLMFKGGSTQIYQSSFFTGVCLFSAAGLGLSFLPRVFAYCILGVSVIWFFALWMSPPVSRELQHMPSAFGGFSLVVALSTAVIVLLLGWTLWRDDKRGPTCAGPESTKSKTTLSERWTQAFRGLPVGPLTVLLAGVLLFLRKPDSILNPQLWAEDGTLFFQGAYDHGLGAFFTTYGGYIHGLPRIAAWLALKFDPALMPALFNGTAVAAQLAVAAAVFSPRLKLPTKPLFALLLVLVPHTGEVFCNLTNVQWIFAAGLVLLALAEDATTPLQHTFDLVVMLICGLTGPFSVFLFPLFAARAYLRRTRASWLLLSAAVLVAGVQAFFIVSSRGEFAKTTPIEPALLLTSLSARHWGTFWGGYGIPAFSPSLSWIVFGVLGLALLLGMAWVPGPHRRIRLVFASAWLCLSLPVAGKFVREAWAIAGPDAGDRYFFLPHLLLIWIILLIAIENRGWRRLAATTAILAALLTNLPHFQAAALPDLHWKDHAHLIRGSQPFYIPINPQPCGIAGDGR